MITLYTNFPYPTEIQDVAKMYFSDVELRDNENEAEIVLKERRGGSFYFYMAKYAGYSEQEHVEIRNVDELHGIRLRKRYAKIALYKAFVGVTGKKMPWGSLTGIRPTKLARQLLSEGSNWQDMFKYVLGVSPKKTQLVEDIITTQNELPVTRGQSADLYIGVPFCVSRCSYCSFTSGEIDKLKRYVDPYLVALCIDISRTIGFAQSRNISLNNVYIGGGTPTSLSARQLDLILSHITFNPQEFTVEAGRPDTITEDKLKVLKDHGVGRISINPQTFNQSVLDTIGRKHTVSDIYDKYEMAKKYGFIVNMDLIAGLPTENHSMFEHSVDTAIGLSPENITVHTLALKHGSALKASNYSATDDTVSLMVEYSHKALHEHSYMPYYMYRQKYVMDNLENVGFCRDNTPCLYNIGIMEETSNILACGTNAISKRIISEENRIERAANAKDVITYIERIDDYLAKKFELFTK